MVQFALYVVLGMKLKLTEYQRRTFFEPVKGQVLIVRDEEKTILDQASPEQVIEYLQDDVTDLFDRDIGHCRDDGENELAEELIADRDALVASIPKEVEAVVAGKVPSVEIAIDPEPFYWVEVRPA